ncbi:uncharacterized protein LOC114535751 [Dendronephthya gigantea]|uniref:uncharacterized protein LOC114535751 n=1 Tax=Dendronephthya gigantea TaxID=151771 RepID=UPI00106D467B|nr:uncharacterized protein LOC114535751 [Dendronephthya gigantea]
MENCLQKLGFYRTFLLRSCSNANCISSWKTRTKRVNIPSTKTGLCIKSYTNNSESDGENSDRSGKLIQLVVTSLRVDRVAASGLGLARRKVDHSLLAGNIFLNGEKVIKKSQQVIEGDTITRISETQPNKDEIKFGQVKVKSIGELTKKGNYHVELLRNKLLSLPVKEFWSKH